MNNNIPLAERLRPVTLEDYIGQEHLVGPDGIIRKMIESGRVNSFILWGPPGVGKTTLAKIVAAQTEVPFYTLSAVTSGVKDVREVLERAEADSRSMFSKGRPILLSTKYTASTSLSKIHSWARWRKALSLLSAPQQKIHRSK